MPDTNEKYLDKRVAQRYMRKGLLDEKDFDQHLKKLPDLADQAVAVESGFDLDDDIEDEVISEDTPA